MAAADLPREVSRPRRSHGRSPFRIPSPPAGSLERESRRWKRVALDRGSRSPPVPARPEPVAPGRRVGPARTWRRALRPPGRAAERASLGWEADGTPRSRSTPERQSSALGSAADARLTSSTPTDDVRTAVVGPDGAPACALRPTGSRVWPWSLPRSPSGRATSGSEPAPRSWPTTRAVVRATFGDLARVEPTPGCELSETRSRDARRFLRVQPDGTSRTYRDRDGNRTRSEPGSLRASRRNSPPLNLSARDGSRRDHTLPRTREAHPRASQHGRTACQRRLTVPRAAGPTQQMTRERLHVGERSRTTVPSRMRIRTTSAQHASPEPPRCAYR
jgi:hypothetical protein